MSKLATPPSLIALTMAALQFLDKKRNEADFTNQLELHMLSNARINRSEQIIVLNFRDGVQEEVSFFEALGEDEYEKYNWDEKRTAPEI